MVSVIKTEIRAYDNMRISLLKGSGDSEWFVAEGDNPEKYVWHNSGNVKWRWFMDAWEAERDYDYTVTEDGTGADLVFYDATHKEYYIGEQLKECFGKPYATPWWEVMDYANEECWRDIDVISPEDFAEQVHQEKQWRDSIGYNLPIEKIVQYYFDMRVSDLPREYREAIA